MTASVVASLLAVGGWVFAQGKPAAPSTRPVAPAPPTKPDPGGTETGGVADATRVPGYVPIATDQDALNLDVYYLFF